MYAIRLADVFYVDFRSRPCNPSLRAGRLGPEGMPEGSESLAMHRIQAALQTASMYAILFFLDDERHKVLYIGASGVEGKCIWVKLNGKAPTLA